MLNKDELRLISEIKKKKRMAKTDCNELLILTMSLKFLGPEVSYIKFFALSHKATALVRKQLLK